MDKAMLIISFVTSILFLFFYGPGMFMHFPCSIIEALKLWGVVFGIPYEFDNSKYSSKKERDK